MNVSSPAEVLSLSLVFRPSGDLSSLARRFVEDCYATAITDPEVVTRLAMTAHELLENAAKYSSDGSASLHVEVDLGQRVMQVRLSNRARDADIASLERHFAEFDAMSDPAALYAQLMRRSALRKSGSGGLGLARIAAEGEMDLDLRVEGNSVEIIARGRLERARVDDST